MYGGVQSLQCNEVADLSPMYVVVSGIEARNSVFGVDCKVKRRFSVLNLEVCYALGVHKRNECGLQGKPSSALTLSLFQLATLLPCGLERFLHSPSAVGSLTLCCSIG